MDGSGTTTTSENATSRRGFTKIPHDVLYRLLLKLDGSSLKLWLVMRAEAKQANELAKEITELAELMEVEKSTIIRSIKRLKIDGLISSKKRGKSTVYILADLEEQVANLPRIGGKNATHEQSQQVAEMPRSSGKSATSQVANLPRIGGKNATRLNKEEDFKTNTRLKTSPSQATGLSSTRQKSRPKKSESIHHQLIAYYVSKWEEKYQTKCPFRPVDAKKISELMIACGGCIEDAKAVIDRYLAEDGKFYRGHSTALLTAAAILPKFIVKPADDRDDSGLLGFREPTDEDLAVISPPNTHGRTS